MSRKKLKILQVITSLGQGGAERLVADLSLRLKRDGDEVAVFLFDGTPTALVRELEAASIKVIAGGMGYRQRWSPLHFFKLRKLLRRENFDIVHSHNTPAQILTALASTKKKKSSYVTTEHNTRNRRRALPILRILDRRMYEVYDRVACVSEKTRSNLLEYLGEPAGSEKYITVRNGIDLKIFRAGGSERQSAESGKKIILMAAAFRRQKDHDTVLRALESLPEEYEVWFAGIGSEEGRVRKLTAEKGLDRRVVFLGHRNDMPELYRQADVVVLSTHYEGLPLSIVEGMASGVPCVGSEVEGLSEVLSGGGILFPAGDESRLAEIIRRLDLDREFRERTVRDCLRRAEDFDVEHTLAGYKEIYDYLKGF